MIEWLDFIPKWYIYFFYLELPNYINKKKRAFWHSLNHKIDSYSENPFSYYLIVVPIKYLIVLPIKYLVIYPIKYLIIYPIIYLIKMLIIAPLKWAFLNSVSYYLSMYCWFTGQTKVIGWDPLLLPEMIPWGSYIPVTLPVSYYQMKYLREYKEAYGYQECRGHLRRIVSPQMYYANPTVLSIRTNKALQSYYDYLHVTRFPYTLNPEEVVFYQKSLKINNFEIAKWNIQMDVTVLGMDQVDLVLVLLSIFIIFGLTLWYFIFYHIGRYKIYLGQVDYFLEDNDKELLEKYKLIRADRYIETGNASASMLQSRWREGIVLNDVIRRQWWHYIRRHKKLKEKDYPPRDDWFVGIDASFAFDTITYFATDGAILLILYRVYNTLYSYYMYYIWNFYCINEMLGSYIIWYFSFLACVYNHFVMKEEFLIYIHRWEDIDYYTAHLYLYYWGGIFFLSMWKLVSGVPIYWYVAIWTFAILIIYFDCDSEDRFMGWDQPYRRDVYYGTTEVRLYHWWWPREEMNGHWYHFYMVVCIPWHRRFVYYSMYIILPLIPILVGFIKLINKIHVAIHNRFFIWSSKRFTIDEILAQWKKDKIHNYVHYERTRFGGWLIIL